MKSKEFTLTVNSEQLKVIEAGLKELPGKYCISVLEDIFKQISKQIEEEKSEDKNLTKE